MEYSPRVAFHRRKAAHDPALRLYAILDAGSCASRGLNLFAVARAWRAAGVQLVQYRDKSASRDGLLVNAKALRMIFPPGETFLLLNDHPALVEQCGFDGAHIGQGDADPADAREQIGADRILGLSTHSADQALVATSTEADYIAIGPVYATTTKADAQSPVGLCGVQAARAIATKPLVAIGGISLHTAAAVRTAGADAVAMIGALIAADITTQAKMVLERLA